MVGSVIIYQLFLTSLQSFSECNLGQYFHIIPVSTKMKTCKKENEKKIIKKKG